MLKRTLPLLTALLGIFALSWGAMVQPVVAANSVDIFLQTDPSDLTGLVPTDVFTVSIMAQSATGSSQDIDGLSFIFDYTNQATATGANATTPMAYLGAPFFNPPYPRISASTVELEAVTGFGPGAPKLSIPTTPIEIANIQFEMNSVGEFSLTFDPGHTNQVSNGGINETNTIDDSATDPTPLQVALSEMGVSPQAQSQGAMAFAVLMFVTTAALIYHKRREA